MATNRFFTVMPRTTSIQFFEDDSITVELRFSDENDKLIRAAAPSLDKTAPADIKKRKEIFSGMVGKENAERILERIDEPDCFVLDQLIVYTARTYIENRQKNLNSAATGKLK